MIVRLVLAAVLAVLSIGPATAIDIKQVTTPLGIKAWLVEDSSAPVVALSFSFASGARRHWPPSRSTGCFRHLEVGEGGCSGG